MRCTIPAKYIGFRVLHHRYEIAPFCVLSYTVTVATMYVYDIRIAAQLYIVLSKGLYFLRYSYLFFPFYSGPHFLYLFFFLSFFLSFTRISFHLQTLSDRDDLLLRLFYDYIGYLQNIVGICLLQLSNWDD